MSKSNPINQSSSKTSPSKNVYYALSGTILIAGAVGYYYYSKRHSKQVSSTRLPEIKYSQRDLQRFNAVFKKLDRNGDGNLDRFEIRHMAKIMYVPNDKELNQLIQEFDTNKDGKISFEEFVETLQKAPYLTQIELDKSFQSDNKTIQQVIPPLDQSMKDELKLQFDHFDINKDGVIDRDEAVELARATYIPSKDTLELICNELFRERENLVTLDDFARAMKRAQMAVQLSRLEDSKEL
jgi:Ca2+-binding EF-hand superfamily protein